MLTEAKKKALGRSNSAFAGIGAKALEGVAFKAIGYLASLAAQHFGS